jgi:hypothetical protein
LIYLLLSVMLVLTLVGLAYGKRDSTTSTPNNWNYICSWILDMADTVRTQTLIGYYENISRTKSAMEEFTTTKNTRFVSS